MSSQTISNKVVSRIYGNARGWVFTPDDFAALGSKDAVWAALSRLCTRGTIRRLARGLYDYPQTHPQLGLLTPSPTEIAQALARAEGSRILPTGAYAANLLGLSEQVPAQIVFLTDGRSRTVHVGNTQIRLKKATVRQMAAHDRISGLVIQALRYLGSENTDAKVVATLEAKLKAEDRKQLMKDVRYAPEWIGKFIRGWAQSAG